MLRASTLVDDACVMRYRTPVPRLRDAWAMARDRAARAAVDLSDGLADAVRQLADASGLGARIDAAVLPIDPGARRWFDARGEDPVLASIGASDDYEMLFAVSPAAKGRFRAARAGSATPFTCVGTLTKQPGCYLTRDGVDAPLPAGFEHFASA
jgi:thiamine-monophosphate kinase